jgi:hypothetical protein
MSKPERLPYIGVTGFTDPKQVESAIGNFAFGSSMRRREMQLMVGVLATYKSLRGIPMKPKWAQQTPESRQISGLFDPSPHALNLVHFSTEEHLAPMTILGDMVKAMIIGGEHCHGLQLNMVWPDRSVLQTFRDVCGNARVVLQIGNKAQEVAGLTPAKIATYVKLYDGLIDDVLFDPSGDLGQPFTPSRAQDVLSEIEDLDMNIGLGVAGGLGPGSLHMLDGLIKRFPNLSIDAQGQLRDELNNLDTERVSSYISQSAVLLGNYCGT